MMKYHFTQCFHSTVSTQWKYITSALDYMDGIWYTQAKTSAFTGGRNDVNKGMFILLTQGPQKAVVVKLLPHYGGPWLGMLFMATVTRRQTFRTCRGWGKCYNTRQWRNMEAGRLKASTWTGIKLSSHFFFLLKSQHFNRTVIVIS